MNDKFSINLDDLPFIPTAHAAGIKKTFFSTGDQQSSLTQFAFGKLNDGEVIPAHQHPTMEEFFYFIKGSGTYQIDDQVILLAPGTAVRIPAGFLHSLEAAETLEFVYFGIAI